MRDDGPIPLHVVTGFLGSGKTTLINRLMRARELADALVVVNEWGEVGLDHLLFEAVKGDVILLASGCLCCSLRGDLVDCLGDVLARRDSGALARFSRIVLETSGLSDPAPILHALMADPLLARRTILAGVTTLVDAVNGEGTLATHGEARRQVALADRIALTKSDLVEAPDRAARLAVLRAAIADINPFAPILDAAAGEFDLEVFLGEPLDFSPRANSARAGAHAGLDPRLRLLRRRSPRRARAGAFPRSVAGDARAAALAREGIGGARRTSRRAAGHPGRAARLSRAAPPTGLAGRRARDPCRRHRRRRRARCDRPAVARPFG